MIAGPPRREDRGDPRPADRPAPWRPGPFTRWRLREVRGWPPALAPDRMLLDQCVEDGRDPSVMEELTRRLHREEGRLGRFPWGAALVELAVYVPLVMLPFTHGLGATLGWLVVVILVEWQVSRRALHRMWHPRFRALLRRHGVDCCIRCGQLAGGVDPAGSCPECGQRHEHVPLGW